MTEQSQEAVDRAQEDGFEPLLEYIKLNRGFDFTGYKRPSLMRRDREAHGGGRRRDLRRVPGLPRGATRTSSTSSSTRSSSTSPASSATRRRGTTCARDVVPRDRWRTPPDDADQRVERRLRVGPGGVHARDVLAEALGEERFRERVKIYATDVDEEALATARQARATPATERRGVPARAARALLRARGRRYAFRKDLRRAVIFGRNDLVQDAPISRIDLLVCRNTLMYFNAETQARILRRLPFRAARRRLSCCSGKAGDAARARGPVRARSTSSAGSSARSHARRRRRPRACAIGEDGERRRSASADAATLRDAAFEAGPVAQIVVDTRRGARARERRARARCSGSPRRTSAGRSQDLELSYRPVELRSLIDRPQAERRTVAPGRRVAPLAGDEPLPRRAGRPALRRRRSPVGRRHLRRHHALSPAAGGAGAIRRRARDGVRGAAVDDRGARDDERGAAVDERGARDDERGAAVDERGARDDERGAAVDERGARDDQRRAARADRRAPRGERVPRVGPDQIDAGVAVVDDDLSVSAWNAHRSDLWGLRPEEVDGRAFPRTSTSACRWTRSCLSSGRSSTVTASTGSSCSRPGRGGGRRSNAGSAARASSRRTAPCGGRSC